MSDTRLSRRAFVKRSATAAASVPLSLASAAYAGGDDTIRVGLVGCGGRGTGAASQALNADPNTKLVAMGEAFAERLQMSLNNLGRKKDFQGRIDVPPERQFVGFDCYQHVIDHCDVVLLATPPHFRPQHLQYAVEKGVHVFCEKPVATDAPGIRAVLDTCETAKQKNLSIVSGLCWRYYDPRVETMQRIHDGQLGDLVAIETTYNSGGVWDPRRTRERCGSEMEYQMWNWYYYTWLSGDHIVEQAIHALDTMGWALGDEPPLKCWGSGGRQVRTDPKYGNIYDHFSLVYEYDNGVRGYHHCRHWKGAATQVKDFILGTKGICDVRATQFSGQVNWRHEGPRNSMYQTEHDELFKSIRDGKPINNGLYMSRSSLLAIMGRMAAYTGQAVTWEQALNSQQSLSPEAYQWGAVPQRPVARPGTTKLV